MKTTPMGDAIVVPSCACINTVRCRTLYRYCSVKVIVQWSLVACRYELSLLNSFAESSPNYVYVLDSVMFHQNLGPVPIRVIYDKSPFERPRKAFCCSDSQCHKLSNVPSDMSHAISPLRTLYEHDTILNTSCLEF